jgi:hypothetical protein
MYHAHIQDYILSYDHIPDATHAGKTRHPYAKPRTKYNDTDLRQQLLSEAITLRTKQELDVAIGEGRHVATALNSVALDLQDIIEAARAGDIVLCQDIAKRAEAFLKDSKDRALGDNTLLQFGRSEAWLRFEICDIYAETNRPLVVDRIVNCGGDWVDPRGYMEIIKEQGPQKAGCPDRFSAELRKQHGGEICARHKKKGKLDQGTIFAYTGSNSDAQGRDDYDRGKRRICVGKVCLRNTICHSIDIELKYTTVYTTITQLAHFAPLADYTITSRNGSGSGKYLSHLVRIKQGPLRCYFHRKVSPMTAKSMTPRSSGYHIPASQMLVLLMSWRRRIPMDYWTSAQVWSYSPR